MHNRIYGKCKICKEPIRIGYLTEGKDGDYYCPNCLIDINRRIDIKSILKRRQNELRRQLAELEIELGENQSIDFMYH